MSGKLKGKKEPKKVRNFWDEEEPHSTADSQKRKKGLKVSNQPKKLRKKDLYEDEDQ